jgi:hypothetical protein
MVAAIVSEIVVAITCIAVVLIIPSSWGSQLGDHLHAISCKIASEAK